MKLMILLTVIALVAGVYFSGAYGALMLIVCLWMAGSFACVAAEWGEPKGIVKLPKDQ